MVPGARVSGPARPYGWVGVAVVLAGCAPPPPPPPPLAPAARDGSSAASGAVAPAPAAAPYTLVTDASQVPDDPDAVWLVRAVTERPRMTRPVVLVYPDSLRDGGVGGDVVVEFVVDTLGRVEPGVRVLEAAHAGLAAPAQRTIAPARFQPGHVNGRKVRVLMTLRFQFTPRRS